MHANYNPSFHAARLGKCGLVFSKNMPSRWDSHIKFLILKSLYVLRVDLRVLCGKNQHQTLCGKTQKSTDKLHSSPTPFV